MTARPNATTSTAEAFDWNTMYEKKYHMSTSNSSKATPANTTPTLALAGKK